MPAKTITKASAKIGDDAVKARTGKVWKEWFALLDKAGAKKMTHQEIAGYLHEQHDVPPWWTQMITVTYEQARGLREKHEKPEGYSISVSRTIKVSLPKLYKAFANEKDRRAWLPEDGLAVRKANVNKTMRVTWKDGKTSLEIYFQDKGSSNSQVVVQHSKLRDAKAAAKMKSYWATALDRLRDKLTREK